MKNVVILTHRHCIDGTSAAFILYDYYNKLEESNMKYSIKFILVDPSDPSKEIAEFKEYCQQFGCYKAYSVDIGYKYQDFNQLIEIFPKIIILDHHISSYNDISTNFNNILPTNYIFKNDKSGATLMWEYFYPVQPVPLLFQYVEDRDLWKFQLKDSKIITEGMYNILSFDNFNIWGEFIKDEKLFIKRCYDLGSALVEINERKNNDMIDKGKIITIDGYKVFHVNTMENISTLGSTICQMVDTNGDLLVDYALIWHYNAAEELFKCSLRSNAKTDVDVSKIAKGFNPNGGGHKNAAGFTCKNLFDYIITNE